MITNYAHGHLAEQIAAAHLKRQGYRIRDTNWKTRYCEIDIVAEKTGCIYFVEVKYRQTDSQGTGFDYITPKKIKRMTFAAEVWVQVAEWRGDYVIAAVEVSGEQHAVSQMLRILI
jgi:Holliday junction resolvase-like predicted endonuclease